MTDDAQYAWIQTYSGKRVYPLDPRPENISIIDIAHALSQVCRFTGHVRYFLSVGQHSVLVSRVVPPEHALWGLLHDGSEAYLADLARPVKRQAAMSVYRDAEKRLMKAITDKFGLPEEMPAAVDEADTRMLLTEKRDALTPSAARWKIEEFGLKPYEFEIVSWSPAEAKARFLERFVELTS
jgi:5'-deoxynucleotidase YfbR-like HD superfamily hydrolase